MSNLTKDQILVASDRKLKEVEIEEWGGSVHLAPMTILNRVSFESDYFDGAGAVKNINSIAMIYDMIRYTVVDRHGQEIFDGESIHILDNKNSRVVRDLFAKCLDLNALKKDDVEKVKKKLPKTN